MPRLIAAPTVIAAAGNKPKRIEEYAGRVNSGHSSVSVARMVSPDGWVEPGQRPTFEEITVVLKGMRRRIFMRWFTPSIRSPGNRCRAIPLRSAIRAITQEMASRPMIITITFWILNPEIPDMVFAPDDCGVRITPVKHLV